MPTCLRKDWDYMDNNKEIISKMTEDIKETESITEDEVTDKVLEHVTGGGFAPKPIKIPISSSSTPEKLEYAERNQP